MFLSDILQKEKWLRELMADKKPLVMMHENWQKHIAAVDCHICNKSLVKDLFLDSMPVHDNDTGRYCGQSHRKCYYEAMKKNKFIGPQRQREDEIDQRIAKNQETCLFCAESLLVKNHKDSVKDHCHITAKYRGAAHNECNFKLKLTQKRCRSRSYSIT